MDAANHGFRTVLVSDACCELEDQTGSPAKKGGAGEKGDNDWWKDLQKHGIAIASTDDIENMLSCRDRRPELGYVSALNYAIALKKLTTVGATGVSFYKHLID